MKWITWNMVFLVVGFGSVYCQTNITKFNGELPYGAYVNSWNGNLFYTRNDINIAAQGDDLQIKFYYNSRNAQVDTAYGKGWSMNFDMHYENLGGSICIKRGDSRVDTFNWTGTTYQSPTGTFESLKQYLPNRYRLTTREGMRYYFDNPTNKKLTQIKDRNGNTLQFIYNGNAELETIASLCGTSLSLDWLNGRLSRITDSTDTPHRTYQYQYDGNGRLVTYTDPKGETETYHYDGNDRMDTLTNKNGNNLALQYTSSGAIQLAVSSLSQQTFQYDMVLRETTIQESVGTDLQTSRYTYDSIGRLIKKESNCCGSDRAYSYDSNNNIIREINESGDSTVFQYDSLGLLVAKTDVLGIDMLIQYQYDGVQKTDAFDKKGNRTNYEYDAFGNLLRMDLPQGVTKEFTYDANGNILSETDANGNLMIHTYDGCGNPSSDTLPQNIIKTYNYDSRNMLLSQTDANGCTTTYSYDALDRRILQTDGEGLQSRFTYDASGNLDSIRDFNDNLTTYTYDGLNRLVQTIEPHGVITTYTYDAKNLVILTDPNGNMTEYKYDSLNRQEMEINGVGDTTSYGYDERDNMIRQTDGRGNTTYFEYDALDRMIRLINAVGDTVSHSYDANGNEIFMTDEDGFTTSYTYDSLDRLLQITDAIGAETNYTYDAEGNLVQIEDANGNSEFRTYDALNRLDSVIDAFGNSTAYSYDGENNPLSIIDRNGNSMSFSYDCINRIRSVTNGMGETISYTYDGNGNEIQRILPNGNRIQIHYDSLNRVSSTTDTLGLILEYTYDQNDNVTSRKDANGFTTTYVYDGLDRVIREINPKGKSMRFVYDPNSNVVRDTNRREDVKHFEYDNLDRLIKTTDPLSGTVLKDYDGRSNLTDLTDEKGFVTRYVYDGMDRRIRTTYADSTIHRFIYDGVGNRIERIDAKGDTTKYQYDALNRLILRDYPGSNDDSFTYDSADRLETADNEDASITFHYDQANRLIGEQLNGRTITFPYDQLNNRRTVTYPDGRQFEREFDLRDRLHIIREGPDTLVRYTYDNAGRILERRLVNGTLTQMSYDSNDWVTQIIHSNPTNFLEFEYDHDAEGNRRYTNRVHRPEDSEEFIYDNLQRIGGIKVGTLVGDQVPAPLSQSIYNYDGSGNRVFINMDGDVKTYTPNKVNEYSEIIDTTIVKPVYDQNGNLLWDGKTNFIYDQENRLTTINTTTRYAYDPLGRRVRKIVGGYITEYSYYKHQVVEEILVNPNCPLSLDLVGTDQSVLKNYEVQQFIRSAMQIIENSDVVYSAGDSILLLPGFSVELGSVFEALINACSILSDTPQISSYVFGVWVDDILNMQNAGTDYYFHQDGLRSTSAVTDAAGNVVERYSYAGYGKPTFMDPTFNPTSSSQIDNPYLFTGRRFDNESGLYFYRSRQYDPLHGRYLQRDPLGYVDGTNLYQYVKGNPINLVDPFGLSFENLGWKWGTLPKKVGGRTNVYYNVVIECYCVKKYDWRIRVVSADIKTRLTINKRYKQKDNRIAEDGTDNAQGIYGHEMKHVEAIENAVNKAFANRGSLQRVIAKATSTKYPSKRSCWDNLNEWRTKILEAMKKVVDSAAGHDNDDKTDKPEKGKPYHDETLPAPIDKKELKRQNKRLKGFKKYPVPEPEWK